jgi:hypothetical protein
MKYGKSQRISVRVEVTNANVTHPQMPFTEHPSHIQIDIGRGERLMVKIIRSTDLNETLISYVEHTQDYVQ